MPDQDFLSLPQQPAPYTEPLSLEMESQSPVVSGDVARSRAAKASLGLSDITGHWPGDFYNFIASGRENDMRQEAAAKVNALNATKRQREIARLAALKDPDQINKLLAQPTPQADPSSVVEDMYAHSYMHPLLNPSSPWVANSEADTTDLSTRAFHNIGAGIVAKREYFQKTLEDLEAEVHGQSWPGYLADQAKIMFQPYDEVKLRGNTDQVGFFRNFLGENLADQAEAINKGWPATKDKFDETIARLKEDNPSIAYMFANYVMGQSTDSRVLDDAFSMFSMGDALGVGAVGISKFTGKRLTSASAVWGATRDLAKSTENVGVPPKTLEQAVVGPIKQSPHVEGLAAVGDQEGAAVAKKAEQAIRFVKGQSTPEVDALEALPDVMRLDRAEREANAGAYGREINARINDGEQTYLKALMTAITNTLRVNRIPDIVWSEQQFRKVAEAIRDKYPGLSNSLMNITGPIRRPISNTWAVQFVLGNENAEYFPKWKDAKNWADAMKIPLQAREVESGGVLLRALEKVGGKLSGVGKIIPGATIEKDGYGYYISKMVPINELDDVVRDALGHTEGSAVKKDFMGGWLDATISLMRNPDETQALDQTFARKIATTAPSNFLETVRDNLKEMRKISPASNIKSAFNRERWDRFERTLRYGQTARDKDTGLQGYFFKGTGDLEEWYLAQFKDGLPDQDFEAAYFEFKRIVESDRWFRIIATVRNKYRLGAESHVVSTLNKDGKLIKSDPFDGILTREPIGGEGTTLVVDENLGTSELLSPDDLPDLNKVKTLNEELAKGKWTHLKTYDPQSYPLKRFLNEIGLAEDARVQHVLTRNVETRPLDWSSQVGRAGGGHLEQDHPYYLKWAKMAFDPIAKKWWYHGDGTFAAGDSPTVLQGYAEHINHIHELMDAGKETEAQEYHASSNLPMAWKDLKADYKPTFDPLTGEKKPPRLNPKEKLRVVPRDKMIADLDNDLEVRYGRTFRDGTRQGSPARQAQVQFTGERDVYELQQVQDKGTRYSPLYDLTPTKLIDPIPMMNRAMGTIINNLFMDDVKNTAVEHWLFGNSTGDGTGAMKFLDATPEEIKHSPFYYFLNPKWRTGVGANVPTADTILRLEADKIKIQQFLGTYNRIYAALDAVAIKFNDSIYSRFGPAAARYTKWVPEALVGTIKNGPQFMRNVLYRAKMGYFSPRQFFIHFFTIMNGMLIAGADAGTHGGFAALLHLYSRMNSNPEVLAHMDGLMEKFGWKPGWWNEAREGALRTGFFHVERGRLALIDNPLSDNVFDNWRQSFLEKGQITFRAGVRSLKAASWYMAYHEWRKLNPIARLDDEALSRVLERADILSHNMTRASTSNIQRGITTFGAQFTAYNLRVLELLTGKRLTPMEKMRLFFGYGTVLGVPTALGIVPLSTYLYDVRQHAQEGGYVPGDKFISTAFMEGLLPSIVYGATGHLYNIGESYGAKDLDIVDKALSGDATFWQVLTGAAGSMTSNIAENRHGLWNAMLSMYRGDGKFKLTGDDFLDMFKEISTVNYIWRAYVGVKTGQMLSRNQAYLAPTTKANAIASGLLGLQEQSVADIYNKQLTVNQYKEAEKTNFKLYNREMQRYMRALQEKDYSNADVYGKRAAVYLSMIPDDRKAQAIADVLRNNEDLRSRVDWNYYVGKDVPDNLRPDKLDTYQKIQKRQGLQ